MMEEAKEVMKKRDEIDQELEEHNQVLKAVSFNIFSLT